MSDLLTITGLDGSGTVRTLPDSTPLAIIVLADESRLSLVFGPVTGAPVPPPTEFVALIDGELVQIATTTFPDVQVVFEDGQLVMEPA